MRFDKWAVTAQEALQSSVTIAADAEAGQVMPIHLLKALMSSGERNLRAIIERGHERGVTVIQVTHSMDDAASSEQVIVLDEGGVLMHGTPHEVFCAATAETLHACGLGLPHPLTWALRLEEEGMAGLGRPLTLDALVEDIVATSGEVRHGV